jgi:hypothetical protein
MKRLAIIAMRLDDIRACTGLPMFQAKTAATTEAAP